MFLSKLNYQTKGIVSHRKIEFESKTVALFWFEKRKYGKKSRLSITLATDYWLLQKEKKKQSIKYTTKKKMENGVQTRVGDPISSFLHLQSL